MHAYAEPSTKTENQLHQHFMDQLKYETTKRGKMVDSTGRKVQLCKVESALYYFQING